MVADLFHYGHVEFLKQASAFGDHLLVGINSDESVQANKRMPILSMEERVASVAGCRYVDEVVPDAPWIMDAAWIAHIYKVHISMGIFRTVPYTPTISTTEIIRRCQEAKIEQS